MLRFSLLTFLLAAILYGGVAFGASQGWFEMPSFALESTLFLMIAHAGMFGFVTRHLNQQPGDFVKIYLGSAVLRILFFGVFIFLVIRLDPVSSTGNALFFLVSYFLFTGLEVVALYRTVNRNMPIKTGQKGL